MSEFIGTNLSQVNQSCTSLPNLRRHVLTWLWNGWPVRTLVLVAERNPDDAPAFIPDKD